MYDVLVFLFENCQQAELAYDQERVARKLSAAGFEDSDISEALHWLAGMTHTPRSVREKAKPALVVANALKPRLASSFAVPMSQGLGMTKAPFD